MFGYDLKQAATYYFKQYGILNFIILLVLLLLSIFFPLCYLIANIFILGYFVAILNYRIHKPEKKYEISLDIFKNSAKIFVISIPYIILSCVYIHYVVEFFLYLFADKYGSGGLGNFAPAFLGLLVGSAAGVITFLILSFPAFCIQFMAFSVNLKLKSAYKISVIKHILIKNFGKYTQLLIIVSLLVFLTFIISLPLLPICVVLLLYVNTIIIDLEAQFIRKAFKIDQLGAKNS